MVSHLVPTSCEVGHEPAGDALVAAAKVIAQLPRMKPDPHAVLRDAALDSVLRGEGRSDPATRLAAAMNVGLPADLRPLVEKIHQAAYKVTDADVASAQAVYGDDALFEIIVSASLGASEQRLRAGLQALEHA